MGRGRPADQGSLDDQTAFEPAGCGRVLYGTSHTTDDSHEGLVPLHPMMEIGVCKEGAIPIEPRASGPAPSRG